jgi:hypothetical protein
MQAYGELEYYVSKHKEKGRESIGKHLNLELEEDKLERGEIEVV